MQDDAWITREASQRSGAGKEERGEERAAQNEELSADVIAGDGATEHSQVVSSAAAALRMG